MTELNHISFFLSQFCWICRRSGHCFDLLPFPAHKVADDKTPWDGNATPAISDAVIKRVFRWEMKSIWSFCCKRIKRMPCCGWNVCVICSVEEKMLKICGVTRRKIQIARNIHKFFFKSTSWQYITFDSRSANEASEKEAWKRDVWDIWRGKAMASWGSRRKVLVRWESKNLFDSKWNKKTKKEDEQRRADPQW